MGIIKQPEKIERRKMPACIDPDASIVKCFICDTDVKTCDGKNGQVCLVHPKGVELAGGKGWVCSQKCWEIAAEKEEKNQCQK